MMHAKIDSFSIYLYECSNRMDSLLLYNILILCANVKIDICEARFTFSIKLDVFKIELCSNGENKIVIFCCLCLFFRNSYFSRGRIHFSSHVNWSMCSMTMRQMICYALSRLVCSDYSLQTKYNWKFIPQKSAHEEDSERTLSDRQHVLQSDVRDH